MNKLIGNIDKQIEFNRNKNILFENLDAFQFSHETVEAISQIDRLNSDSKQLLIDYATDKAIEEFCRVNQYYSFDSNTKTELKKIYADLFESLKTLTHPIEEISSNHYTNLKSWLKINNPFAEKIYENADTIITPVACSEYSKDLQLDILKIDIEQLISPVLDIGCGSQGNLVNYFVNNGIESYGIDRCKFSSRNFLTTDWLEYNYETEKWGTIISNLGFSNHFNHHNLREDGKYIKYAKTYMNILNSLKIGGKFHYAPDLDFIEKYLDNRQFSIQKHKMIEYEFETTVITRLN